MSLFGDDDEVKFQGDLKSAIRKRILAEVAARQAAGGGQVSPASIVNNLYGGAANASSGGGGGVMDRLGGGGGPSSPDDDPFDYLVDITRKDMPINPETGKPGGWEKKVHRYRQEKKK